MSFIVKYDDGIIVPGASKILTYFSNIEHAFTCDTYFVFSKHVPKFIEKHAINKYMSLRHHAVDLVNPYFDEWNLEFGERDVDSNDPLRDCGGTEYCKFICDKQRPAVDYINRKNRLSFIKLDLDDRGNFIGRIKGLNITVIVKIDSKSIKWVD